VSDVLQADQGSQLVVREVELDQLREMILRKGEELVILLECDFVVS